MNPKQPPSLHSVIFKLLASRWILFSVIIALIVLGSSYLSGRNQINRQQQAAVLLSKNAGSYFESARKVLQAVAGMAPDQDDLDAIQQAYTTIDALYLISPDGQLLGISPHDNQLAIGMDMSGQPYYDDHLSGFSFSKPFISQRTGNPTIYISSTLDKKGDMLVGELSLAGLGESISGSEISPIEVFYITDADGVILAHPNHALASQQDNIRQLGIIDQLNNGKARWMYRVNGRWVVGVAVTVPQTGWLAIAETPISAVYGSFLGPAVLGMLMVIILYMGVVRREQAMVTRQVIQPMEELSRIAHNIAVGDTTDKVILSLPAAYREVASLADSFQRMKEAVQSRTQALHQSQERYRSLFEDSPTILLEEDFSKVKQRLDDFRAQGVVDFKEYLAQRPEELAICASLVKIVDANRAALKMHGPTDKNDLIQTMMTRVLGESGEYFRDELEHIANGDTHFQIEVSNTTLDGKNVTLNMNWAVVPGHEDTLSKVIVAMNDITERKQAGDALKESEYRYHMLFEHSAVPIWEEDFSEVSSFFERLRQAGVRDFRNHYNQHPEDVHQCAALVKILDVNQKSLDFFHVRSQVDIVRNLPFYFTEESWPVFKEEIIALAEGQNEFSSEIPIRMLDGEVKHLVIFISVSPIYQKTLERVLVSFIDISERKLVEEALLESEEKHRLLIENSHDIIYTMTVDGVFIFVSPAWTALLGHPVSQVAGQSFQSFVHAEDIPECIVWLKNVIQSGKRQEGIEYRARHMDGTWYWHTSSAVPLYDASGAVIGFEGTARDITERKMADRVRHESEERYRSLFEDSPTILMEEDFSAVKQLIDSLRAQGVTDFREYLTRHPDLVMQYGGLVKVLDFNKAALKLHGLSSKAEIPKNLTKIISKTNFDQFLEEWERIARGETQFEIEVTDQTLDGRTVTLSMNWAVVPGHEHDLSKVIISLLDITERKALTEKMILSEKMAGLGTLAAGVAHEINSPLQVITAASETLLTRLKENNLNREGIERRVKHILENSWRIVKIVRSLLDYARSPQEEMAPTSLDSIVNDALLLIEHQIHVWSNIQVFTELGKDLPDLICDRNKIIQVVINLLSNARDAMPHGGTATLRSGFDPISQRLSLSVSDSGEGIPDAVLTRIFDPFFTTKQLGKGTGLGLSLVQGIIGAHGGEITVESRVGEGSTFTIHLPLVPTPGVKQIEHSHGRYQVSESGEEMGSPSDG